MGYDARGEYAMCERDNVWDLSLEAIIVAQQLCSAEVLTIGDQKSDLGTCPTSTALRE